MRDSATWAFSRRRRSRRTSPSRKGSSRTVCHCRFCNGSQAWSYDACPAPRILSVALARKRDITLLLSTVSINRDELLSRRFLAQRELRKSVEVKFGASNRIARMKRNSIFALFQQLGRRSYLFQCFSCRESQVCLRHWRWDISDSQVFASSISRAQSWSNTSHLWWFNYLFGSKDSSLSFES